MHRRRGKRRDSDLTYHTRQYVHVLFSVTPVRSGRPSTVDSRTGRTGSVPRLDQRPTLRGRGVGVGEEDVRCVWVVPHPGEGEGVGVKSQVSTRETLGGVLLGSDVTRTDNSARIHTWLRECGGVHMCV